MFAVLFAEPILIIVNLTFRVIKSETSESKNILTIAYKKTYNLEFNNISTFVLLFAEPCLIIY